MPGTPATQLHRTQRLSRSRAAAALAAALLALAPTAARAASPASEALARARLLYNQQQYEQAIAAAEPAVAVPALADVARLVIGRASLERFRQTAAVQDLDVGRNALRQVHAAALTARDRIELLVGLGEALYLANEFGAAAELFASAIDPAPTGEARDTALEWWASALDRLAIGADPDAREAVYAQVVARMDAELGRDVTSAVAAYWLAAASRGAGDLERAWSAAVAGWVRAPLSGARAASLRADLDQLMQTGIIPDHAREMGGDRDQAIAALKKEWEEVKGNWK